MHVLENGGPVIDVLLSPIIHMLCVWMVVSFVASILLGESGWKWTVVKPMRFLGKQLGKFLRWFWREGAKLLWNLLASVCRFTWRWLVRSTRALWRHFATRRRQPAPAPGGAPPPPP